MSDSDFENFVTINKLTTLSGTNLFEIGAGNIEIKELDGNVAIDANKGNILIKN